MAKALQTNNTKKQEKAFVLLSRSKFFDSDLILIGLATV
jgi:hypothetical protein